MFVHRRGYVNVWLCYDGAVFYGPIYNYRSEAVSSASSILSNRHNEAKLLYRITVYYTIYIPLSPRFWSEVSHYETKQGKYL